MTRLPVTATLMLAMLGVASRPATAKVTVTLWTDMRDAATLREMVLAEEAAHPDIDLRAVAIPPDRYEAELHRAMASKLLPDIVGLAPGPEAQRLRPALKALDAVADEELGKGWEHHFPNGLLDEAKLGQADGDGSSYLLPMTADLAGLWISPKAAALARLSSGPPRSTEELVRVSAALRQAGMTPMVVAGGSDQALIRLFLVMLAQDAPDAVRRAAHAAPGVWTDRAVRVAATSWGQFFAGGIIPRAALTMSQGQALEMFASGQAGMIAAGSRLFDMPPRSGTPPAAFFWFPPPAGAKPAPPVGGIGIGWAITHEATGQQDVKLATEEVWRDLIAGRPAQVAANRLAGFPAWDSLRVHSLPPALAQAYRQLGTLVSQAVPDAVGEPHVARALAQQLRLIALGQQSPEAGMRVVQAVAKRERMLGG